MLRLLSLLQAILLVIAAVVSSVHGLGLQDPSAISELHQGHHDTKGAVSIGAGVEDDVSEVSGAGRDLQSVPKKKVIFVTKPKKKVVSAKPKKRIVKLKKKVIKPNKMVVKPKKMVFFFKVGNKVQTIKSQEKIGTPPYNDEFFLTIKEKLTQI